MDWERLLELNRNGLADFHTHTHYCDGNDSPEDMVRAAIARGMKAIGFSGHSHMNFDQEVCMSVEGTKQYRQEILQLRDRYAGQIEIYCGIERDYYDAQAQDAKPGTDWDYIIGSVHYLECLAEDAAAYPSVDDTTQMLEDAIKDYYGGDVYALIEDYYSTVAQVVQRTGADIIGHFNLVCKFNKGGDFGCKGVYFDESDPRYRTAWQKAADQLLQEDVLFEINTGAISRGYREEPYPSLEMQQYIRERGGRFIWSSDSHSTKTLCYGFNASRSK